MKKCRTVEDITHVQRKALMETIKEAEKNEKKRAKQMAKAPHILRQQELRARHERERAHDQERIKNLVSELEQVTTAVQRGEIDMTHREPVGKVPPKLEKMNANRFVSPSLHKFQQEEFRVEEHQARMAQYRSRERFDEYAEKKKLMLLKQKRDVLHKLVSVQRGALGEALGGQGAKPRAHSARRWSDTSSVSTRASDRSSQASYATFGTPAPAPTRRPSVPIPKLKI